MFMGGIPALGRYHNDPGIGCQIILIKKSGRDIDGVITIRHDSKMDQTIRILHITKDASSGSWMEQALAFEGYHALIHSIRDVPALRAALRDVTWDVVVYAWQPDAPLSLRETVDCLHQALSDCPIILCAPYAREQEAMEALRMGAHDYVMTGDSSRFVSVVRREQVRSERRVTQRQSINRLMLLMGNDFNNMLTAISGYGEMAAEAAQESSDIRLYVQEMNRASQRAARLVKQMMALAVQRPSHPHPCSLAGILHDIRKTMGLQAATTEGHGASGSGEGVINVDPDYLMLAMLNLILHVKEQFDPDVALSLFLEEQRTGRHNTGVSCCLEVIWSPSGPACRWPEIGNGFAWEMELHAIAMNGGAVEIQHDPGRNRMRIRFIFPDLEKNDATTTDEQEAAACPRGHESILVVEDDDMVRRLTTRFLRSLGYHVIETNDPDEVLREWGNVYKKTELLITDLVMPGLNGFDLVHRLRKRRRAFRHMYITGFADDAYAAFGIKPDEETLLSKPFSREQLAWAVRRRLDAPA